MCIDSKSLTMGKLKKIKKKYLSLINCKNSLNATRDLIFFANFNFVYLNKDNQSKTIYKLYIDFIRSYKIKTNKYE